MQGQTRVYDLAGIGLSLTIESPSIAYLADWHFGRLPEAISTDETIEITLRRVSGRPDTDLSAARRVASMSVDARPRSLVAEHDGGALVEVDPASITVTLWSDADGEWLCTRQLLFLSLTWVLAHHDRTVVHAALVANDEHGVLLLGGTGQGKSTFAVAALAAGWQVHADDLVVLSGAGSGALTAHGIPKRMSISTDMHALLATNLTATDLTATNDLTRLTDLEPVPGDPRERSFLPLSALDHGPLQLAGVALTGHDEGAGQVRPLDANTTLQAVVTSFGLADEPDILKRVFATLVAVGSLPGFEALHARDANVRLDNAAILLQQMIERSQ